MKQRETVPDPMEIIRAKLTSWSHQSKAQITPLTLVVLLFIWTSVTKDTD